MNAKYFFASIAMLGAAAYAANASVWSSANAKTAMKPAYWNTVKVGTASVTSKTGDDGEKIYKASVGTKATDADEAGALFGWKQDSKKKDVAISLAAYKGMCVTYSATQPFRVSFVQSTVTDGDYHGVVVPASAKQASVFIDFSKLAQQGTGKAVELDLENQLQVQFTYNSALAIENESATDSIALSSVFLGSSCTNSKPQVNGEFAEELPSTLLESDTLAIDLSKLFIDKDEDDLNISFSVSPSGKYLTLVNKDSVLTQKDVLKFVPVKNTSGEVILSITASDGLESATHIIPSLVIKDVENPPVAVDDEYTIKEDFTAQATVAKGVLANDYDLDGDKFVAVLKATPKNGTVTLNKDGSFTYVPKANFNGDDSWTYVAIDSVKKDTSKAATVTMHVDPVNDAPGFVVVDSTFLNDTLSLVEDFEMGAASTITISKKALVFDDADGYETLKFGAAGVGVGASAEETKDAYVITLASVPGFKGLASVFFFATDSLDTVGVKLYVNVTPAPVPPVASGDAYMGHSDSLLSVPAENGVLKNDKRLDVPSAVLTAALVDKPLHGTLNFKADGSFDYLPEAGFMGSDFFTYVAVSDEMLSNVVKVYINIEPPVSSNVLVWSNKNSKTALKPAYWYEFKNGTSSDTASYKDDEGNKGITATVSMNAKIESVAGFGFAWKQKDKKDVSISLADYKGMCLTYKASYPFRVDFKQGSIVDYNYNGMILPEKGVLDTFFVDFAKLAQEEGWGDEVKFDPEDQLGVQFSYKSTIAADNGPKNTIVISSVSLGNSCSNHAPVIFPPYDVAGSEALLESDTLSYNLASMFFDEDGDSLSIYVNIDQKVPVLKVANESKTVFSRNDVLKIVPVPNTSGEATVTIAATDNVNETVLYYVVSVSVTDQQNPPHAVNDEYEVKEDATLKVSILDGVKANDYDLDGEDFAIVLLTKPTHGELTAISASGSFTYQPEPNFYGDDFWTYTVVDSKDSTVVGNVATVTIHVLPVNDKPTIAVLDSSFMKDTVTVNEDFEPGLASTIIIPKTSLVFDDADGLETLSYGAIGKGIEATVEASASSYSIALSPVKDFNGLASLFFFATDSLDTVGVTLYVNVLPVADPPIGVADVYTGYNDSLLSVSAKDGVLKNDTHPDDATAALTAVLGEEPAHGKIVFRTDGSFDYMPDEGFTGRDAFAYYAVSGEALSTPVMVTINIEERNFYPVVVVNPATLDTTVEEDFKAGKALKYSKDVVASWFKDPEGDPLTYSASSEDGKLKPTVSAAGVLTVNSVADSTGDAYVIVTATDKKSGSTSFKIHVTIKPVNDKPVILHADTAYVGITNEWVASWDLDTLVRDIDGDTLVYTPNVTTTLNKYMSVEIKGSILTIKSLPGLTYKDNQLFALGVKCADASTYVTLPIAVVVGERPESLKPVLANAVKGWQNAITAKRGSVSIMDMKGRVMWSAKLPVSAAEVYNASAKVQGRKVLRVNRQTWTIK